MKALGEFRGVNHVSIHIPDENGDPLCNAPREAGNELYGPHEMAVTPGHIDVCDDCVEFVPDSERHNEDYRHGGNDE